MNPFRRLSRSDQRHLRNIATGCIELFIIDGKMTNDAGMEVGPIFEMCIRGFIKRDTSR